MAKKRGLGRNLDALLGGASFQQEKSQQASVEKDRTQQSSHSLSADAQHNDPPAAGDDRSSVELNPTAESTPNGDTLLQLPIERIRRGTYQPRQHFDQDSLQELADSLKQEGLLQPILVRPFADGYELVAGERRWRAAQLAGLHKIPAIVKELNDQSVAAVALIENIQRKDLNPMEEARALQRLQSEFDMTHQEVSDAVGRSRAAVTNLIRLLDLHDEVKVMVDRGDLDMGHARALLGVSKSQQLIYAKEIVNKGLSVRATEKLVKSGLDSSTSKLPKAKSDPNIVALEKQLADTLGAGVNIRHKSSGKGKLEIRYNSLDELDGILQHIK